jgi:Transposase DDE domain
MTKVATPPGRALHQAAVPHRPGRRHSHLPGQAPGVDHPSPPGWWVAGFGRACLVCPLQASCTSSPAGRTITSTRRRHGCRRPDTGSVTPAWRADYRTHRPIVARKLAHLLRRRHGGRRARVRGRLRVAQDWRLLAAAVNLARFCRPRGALETGWVGRRCCRLTHKRPGRCHQTAASTRPPSPSPDGLQKPRSPASGKPIGHQAPSTVGRICAGRWRSSVRRESAGQRIVHRAGAKMRHAKQAPDFGPYGRARPGKTAVRTAVPRWFADRKRSQVQTLSRPP